MVNKYKFDITWSAEDGGFIATCPEFPGLSAFGETRAKALDEAEVVLKLFIESYLEDGEPLPEPQTVQNYSGQIRVRLPKSLHAQAAKLAETDGVSLNQYISNALQAKVAGHQVAERYVKEMSRQLAFYSMHNLSFLKKATFTDREAKIELGSFESKEKFGYSN